MKEVAVLFSGGTDSTAAAALLAQSYDRLHLLSYGHSGIFRPENSRVNVALLRERFGDRFVHEVFDVDRLFRWITYLDYWENLRRFGFFNLTTCGLCKLSMHVRTLAYCLEHGLSEVADGANRHMSHFPAQMREGLDELRAMYERFGIAYTNPVFDYDSPDGLDWSHKVGLVREKEANRDDSETKPRTTGRLLTELGILERENVKGTETDRRMQARCFQLTLHNAFALGYYIPRYGEDAYRRGVQRFYRRKIARISEYLEDFRQHPESGVLARMIDQKT